MSRIIENMFVAVALVVSGVVLGAGIVAVNVSPGPTKPDTEPVLHVVVEVPKEMKFPGWGKWEQIVFDDGAANDEQWLANQVRRAEER